jgi:hypothetical protein
MHSSARRRRRRKDAEENALVLISEIYLEELRMATKILRILSIPTKIRKRDLPNVNHNA